GQTLCITSTGVLQGDLVVNQGSVCNEGTINSTAITMTNGTFTNYGTINSDGMVMAGGDFTNDGPVNIDDISMNGSGNTITNNSTLTARQVAIVKTTFDLNPTINNSGTFTVDSITIGNNSDINNTGTFTVSFDIAALTGSSVSNNGIMIVGRDFANSGIFHTECMIPVGRDWANLVGGFISGPTAGCGGFDVTGASANTGNFAAGGTFLDMCDAGNPGSFDVNTGLAGTNVTYCTCNTVCTIGGGTAVISNAGNLGVVKLYPNPAKDYVVLDLKNWDGTSHTFTLLDLSGKKIKVINLNAGTSVIGTAGLSSGMYLYQLSSEMEVVDYGKLLVE
ncbi:MAG: T9SS type A sorting domain-containing protein, partial [Flavobacteriales bacterium]|nr:T9SS type A sorting domain-containing protein [Flavobacteriales bacterium]